MKVLFSILTLLFMFGCNNHSSQLNGVISTATPTPTVNNNNTNNSPPAPNTESEIDEAKRKESEAQNEKFKIPPEHFKEFDFKNFSYSYRFSYSPKRKINIALKNNEYEYDFEVSDSGVFYFKDVFYVDLTGDGKQEAIVILWHVSCGVSCDGGAGLFYIYSIQQNKLKTLWQFETGSLAYGCGLKSFKVKDRKITMELFGRYVDEKTKDSQISPKYHHADTTRVTFRFDGKKIAEEKREFFDVPERGVGNYRAEISIND